MESSMMKKMETLGYVYGLLGVIGFSLTLPATRIAVTHFSPMVVGLGRALVAAVLAALILWLKQEKLPTWQQWKGLIVVAGGVIIGFPLLSAWAMTQVPASHGAVVIAILPLVTAGMATIRGGERPSLKFWLASAAGCLLILGYTAANGLGGLQLADLALMGAVFAAAVSYAEGGKLARELGGWQVICWALLISAPVLFWPVAREVSAEMLHAPVSVWLSFLYVSVISQFLAFFAWYGGMALAGVARVSQLQYLQPFFTIVGSVLLLGETITVSTLAVSALVVLIVAQGRKAPVDRRVPEQLSSK
ncbi:DMT family transporter [Brevibacillus sp. H7]|uniref:DMT family transporter n=1 Tax=Brevibacillus sp. H7 TaxID=3349138 RepID=UPI00380D2E1A